MIEFWFWWLSRRVWIKVFGFSFFNNTFKEKSLRSISEQLLWIKFKVVPVLLKWADRNSGEKKKQTNIGVWDVLRVINKGRDHRYINGQFCWGSNSAESLLASQWIQGDQLKLFLNSCDKTYGHFLWFSNFFTKNFFSWTISDIWLLLTIAGSHYKTHSGHTL